MTMLGIALVATVFVLAVALAQSIRKTVVSTGSPNRLIVMQASANSETFSIVEQEVCDLLRYIPGVGALTRTIVAQVILDRSDGRSGMVMVRGLDHRAHQVRPEMRVVRGRGFLPGAQEVVLGRTLVGRYSDTVLGGTVRLGRRDFRVVGIFEAGGTAAESEIWGDLDPMLLAFAREVVSTVVIRVGGGHSVDDVAASIAANPRMLGVQAVPETRYYADQVRGLGAAQVAGLVVAALMAVGAVFGAMNTLDGAVASRVAEIATLRALGFSGGAVVASFLIEGMWLGLAGGLIGSLAALPMSGFTTASTNFLSFSEIGYTIHIGPVTCVAGVVFSVVLGFLGGFVPARAAARVPPSLALRA